MRTKAIFCCLYFGIVPSWVYEPTCHYNRGYWLHLKLNFGQAMIWIKGQETKEDREFENTINKDWSFIRNKLFRCQQGAKYKPEFQAV